ncbi:MAG: hypothetical protein ACK5QH_12275 [Rubrivivax sp.]
MRCRSAPESFTISTALRVGKYLITPLARAIDGGHFAAIVSIRSGSGSMTLDRVLRFAPVFERHDQANLFATDQALAWIGAPTGAAQSAPSPRT